MSFQFQQPKFQPKNFVYASNQVNLEKSLYLIEKLIAKENQTHQSNVYHFEDFLNHMKQFFKQIALMG
ncbi:unnamed protein product [Paramecium octaurelia]|uniref:Uncharacterized protein n=1 Tax=Paramecium octaurelia TaxID=43137 RepID=A0A8S1YNP9_PAROT|nr:unnamed protein product [Paramecium octaurelia]